MTRALRRTLGLSLMLSLVSAATEVRAEEASGEQTPEATPTEPAPPSVDDMVAGLSSPDTAIRVSNIRAIGERRDPAMVTPLANLLRTDPVPEVRGWAVRALHDIGTPEARNAVVTAAREDPDERVRSMAAQLGGVSTPPPQPFGPTPAATVSPLTPAPAYSTPAPIAPIQRPPRVPGRGLRVGGWVTTGVSYGLAFVVGIALLAAGDEPATEWDPARNYVDWGWKMLLPIVGPAVASTTNDMGEASIPFWLWTAAQVAGVALLAVGYVQRARHLREQEGGDEDLGVEDPGDEDVIGDDETYEDEDTYDDEDSYDEATPRRFGIAFAPGPGGFSVAGWF